MKSKGQAWVGVIIVGIVGITIAAAILFALLPTIQSSIGNASLTGGTLALANLVPLILVAAFLLVVVGLFLGTRK